MRSENFEPMTNDIDDWAAFKVRELVRKLYRLLALGIEL